jgi:hypothetical protein
LLWKEKEIKIYWLIFIWKIYTTNYNLDDFFLTQIKTYITFSSFHRVNLCSSPLKIYILHYLTKLSIKIYNIDAFLELNSNSKSLIKLTRNFLSSHSSALRCHPFNIIKFLIHIFFVFSFSRSQKKKVKYSYILLYNIYTIDEVKLWKHILT